MSDQHASGGHSLAVPIRVRVVEGPLCATEAGCAAVAVVPVVELTEQQDSVVVLVDLRENLSTAMGACRGKSPSGVRRRFRPLYAEVQSPSKDAACSLAKHGNGYGHRRWALHLCKPLANVEPAPELLVFLVLKVVLIVLQPRRVGGGGALGGGGRVSKMDADSTGAPCRTLPSYRFLPDGSH